MRFRLLLVQHKSYLQSFHCHSRGHAETFTMSSRTRDKEQIRFWSDRHLSYLLPMNPRTMERGHGHPFLFARGQVRTDADRSRTRRPSYTKHAAPSQLLPRACALFRSSSLPAARWWAWELTTSAKARKRYQTNQKFLASYQLLLKSQGRSLLRPLTLSQNHENNINISLFKKLPNQSIPPVRNWNTSKNGKR